MIFTMNWDVFYYNSSSALGVSGWVRNFHVDSRGDESLTLPSSILFLLKNFLTCILANFLAHQMHQARNQDFHAGQAKPALHLGRCASEVARSAAERAAAGVWGRSPQRGPGAEPLVGG